MVESKKVLIENVQNSQFVSDLLQGLEQALRGETNNIELQKEAELNAKGEIIIGIAIGLATNIIYDVLKGLINMYKNRDDFKSHYKLKVDGVEKTLEEIEKEN